LNEIISEYTFDITAVETGFTDGINRNPNFETLEIPKVAMLWAKELIQPMQEKYGICLIKSSNAT
jgi:hypothetical protein